MGTGKRGTRVKAGTKKTQKDKPMKECTHLKCVGPSVGELIRRSFHARAPGAFCALRRPICQGQPNHQDIVFYVGQSSCIFRKTRCCSPRSLGQSRQGHYTPSYRRNFLAGIFALANELAAGTHFQAEATGIARVGSSMGRREDGWNKKINTLYFLSGTVI